MRRTLLYATTLAGLLLAGASAAAPGAAAQETTVIRGTPSTGTGWLGLGFRWEDGAPEQMIVTQVFPGSPAQRAGLRPGDTVLRIGTRAATEAAMTEVRTRLSAGDTLRLRVRRDGTESDRAVVAAARPGREVLVESFLRARGDSLPDVLVFRADSLRTLPLTRLRVDSLIQLRENGRDVVIRMRVDSLRTLTDSLLARVDTLARRVRVHRLRDSTVFVAPRLRGEEVEAMLGEARRLHEGVEIRRGTPLVEGVPFFLELGRRALAGAEFAPMNEGLGRYFATREGLLVLRVSPSTPAARAGLEAGDVVVRAGGRAVDGIEDLREAVRGNEDGRIRLEILRQRRRQEVELRWERDTVLFQELAPGRIRVAPAPAPRPRAGSGTK